MDCRQCNFYLCSECLPVSHCPNNHLLQRWVCQSGGVCDGCNVSVKKGDMVTDCRKCDWFLCKKCCPQTNGGTLAFFGGQEPRATPLPECPNKHKLAPCLA